LGALGSFFFLPLVEDFLPFEEDLLADFLAFLAGERSFDAALFLLVVRMEVLASSEPNSKRLGFLCLRSGRLATDGKQQHSIYRLAFSGAV
jgi:hypothetical protein